MSVLSLVETGLQLLHFSLAVQRSVCRKEEEEEEEGRGESGEEDAERGCGQSNVAQTKPCSTREVSMST